jgi:hypothetical protein
MIRFAENAAGLAMELSVHFDSPASRSPSSESSKEEVRPLQLPKIRIKTSDGRRCAPERAEATASKL